MRQPPPIDDDPASKCVEAGGEPTFAALLQALALSANDLEAPALTLFPPVAETLSALRAIASCRLARMSGSGGTCFGLFANGNDAADAAAALRHDHPGWWVQDTMLGAAARRLSKRAPDRTRPSPPAPLSSETAETAPAHRLPSRRNAAHGRSYLPVRDAWSSARPHGRDRRRSQLPVRDSASRMRVPPRCRGGTTAPPAA